MNKLIVFLFSVLLFESCSIVVPLIVSPIELQEKRRSLVLQIYMRMEYLIKNIWQSSRPKTLL